MQFFKGYGFFRRGLRGEKLARDFADFYNHKKSTRKWKKIISYCVLAQGTGLRPERVEKQIGEQQKRVFLSRQGAKAPRKTQSSIAATKRFKVGSCESGELFFAFAFLFAASSSCEGGEKRTTAKNKAPKVLFGKKSHNILKINRLHLTVLKNTHKKQGVERLYYEEIGHREGFRQIQVFCFRFDNCNNTILVYAYILIYYRLAVLSGCVKVVV